MPQDGLTPSVAEARVAAALANPLAPPPGNRPPPRDDTVHDRERQLGPPDWFQQGKNAPAGWRKVGDTFEEAPRG